MLMNILIVAICVICVAAMVFVRLFEKSESADTSADEKNLDEYGAEKPPQSTKKRKGRKNA